MNQPRPPAPSDMDLGNPLLRRGPFRYSLIRARAPDGSDQLIFTMREGNSTMTLFLDRAEAQKIRDDFDGKIGEMTGLIIPPPNGTRP